MVTLTQWQGDRDLLMAQWRDESDAPHPLGCACWSCILGLLREVAESSRLYRPARRRPLVPR